MAAEDLCGKRRAASRKKGWNASMANGLLTKLFGNYSKRELKRIQPLVDQVLGYEEKYKKISDEELKSQTSWFKERLAQGETLDGILPEAFAACREAHGPGACHPAVPRAGAWAASCLHQGRIAEMKTGEGKTLGGHPACLPQRLDRRGRAHRHRQRLPGQARRRDGWASVYQFHGPYGGPDHARPATRTSASAAYACDITYGTNNEMGFDYLRDNMVIYKEQHGAARPQLRHCGRGGLHPD